MYSYFNLISPPIKVENYLLLSSIFYFTSEYLYQGQVHALSEGKQNYDLVKTCLIHVGNHTSDHFSFIITTRAIKATQFSFRL